MANVLYDSGREGFLDGTIDWDTDNIAVVLVDLASYTLDQATHKFLSDIPAIARISITANLTAKTVVAGIADAADISFVSVTGNQSEALVIFQNTGVDTTARLIVYIDTATGLPVLPNGGNIDIAWNNGVDRIFKL